MHCVLMWICTADFGPELRPPVEPETPRTFQLNNVACTGVESSLFFCDHTGFGNHNCNNSTGSVVTCEGKLLCIHVTP